MSATEIRTIQRRGLLALAGRETRRVLSLWTQTILPPAVTALLFVTVFGGALGPRVGQIEGLDYLAFILPGLLVMTTAGPALANSSTSLFQARSEGYVEDVLTSPLVAWQIVVAYVAGSLVRALAAALVVATLVVPFAGSLAHPTVAAAALALTALAFASLGVIVGVAAETFDQHAFVANLVVTPLALLAGVFYSAGDLDEPWRTLTRLDPLYYLVDAARYGFTGFHEAPVALSLGVTALAAAAVFAAACTLVRRGWRLKP